MATTPGSPISESIQHIRVQPAAEPPANRKEQPTLTKLATRSDAGAYIGYSWPAWKKGAIIAAICAVQMSMNFNASVYANGFYGIMNVYGVNVEKARLGQMAFLIAYGVGSELWAPWSEEMGRWSVLQGSLFLVNCTQILCALAPTFPSLIVGRVLGGLFSAGGSVTLGIVADLWGPDDHQCAVATVVLASVSGSAVGPILGGFIAKYLPLPWIFWFQLIFGAAVQCIHLFVPETRNTILRKRQAKELHGARYGGRGSKSADSNHETQEKASKVEGSSTGSSEDVKKAEGLTWAKTRDIWLRPFHMFFTERIVFFQSLLSGFSDALIFIFLEAFKPVFEQYGFSTTDIGLTFVPIVLGYLIAFVIFFFDIRGQVRRRKKTPHTVKPESRLRLLLYLGPLEAIGLFGFACTSVGAVVPWFFPLFFAMLIAIANFAIYMATIDYMVASYGPYAASATGGNALARDILAGLAALFAGPFYEIQQLGQHKLLWPSFILSILAAFLLIPIYQVYFKGETIRANSKFASTLEQERQELLELSPVQNGKHDIGLAA